MQNKAKKICFILGVFLMVPSFARAAILFQDNFDNCSSNCMSSAITSPTGWVSWHSGANLATHDGVTHYAGEITAPGREGIGKSLKIWRHSVDWGGYPGSLDYRFPSGHRDLYMRYYMKLPIDLDLGRCNSSTFLKLWRINTTTPSPNHEIYLNINQVGGSTRETGRMYLSNNNTSQAYGGAIELLSNEEVRKIWDGNWHSLEFHINLAAGQVELWIDGSLKQIERSTGWLFGDGSFSEIQHFSLGNHADQEDPINGCKWQNTWRALELDDFMLSTTRIGANNPGDDTTPPITPIGLRVE